MDVWSVLGARSEKTVKNEGSEKRAKTNTKKKSKKEGRDETLGAQEAPKIIGPIATLVMSGARGLPKDQRSLIEERGTKSIRKDEKERV